MPAKKAAAKKAPAKKSAAKPRGRKPGTKMSAAHKEALSVGRESGRAVRNYLEALDSHKPKRGRKRTPESITKRLDAIEVELGTADPVSRLNLVQQQLDLTNELASLELAQDMTALEAEFIKHAVTYSQNKGISYTAWRTVGVSAEVLKAAGVFRTLS